MVYVVAKTASILSYNGRADAIRATQELIIQGRDTAIRATHECRGFVGGISAAIRKLRRFPRPHRPDASKVVQWNQIVLGIRLWRSRFRGNGTRRWIGDPAWSSGRGAGRAADASGRSSNGSSRKMMGPIATSSPHSSWASSIIRPFRRTPLRLPRSRISSRSYAIAKQQCRREILAHRGVRHSPCVGRSKASVVGGR